MDFRLGGCALGVTFPLTTEITVRRLRRSGVFVREQTIWARMSRIRRIVFDKTGTLTLEAPCLITPEAIEQLAPADRQTLYHLAADNLHPVSRALRDALVLYPDCSEDSGGRSAPEEIPGKGLQCEWRGAEFRLGKPGWALASSPGFTDEAAGETVPDAVFTRNGLPLARFRFTESLRVDAIEEVARLREQFSVTLLSGDNTRKVAAMCRTLGLPEEAALADLSPDAKEDWVRRNDPDSVLFVGDGANDALAFAAAGVRVTPVADRGLLEQRADAYLLGRQIAGIRLLLEAMRLRRRAIRRLFAVSVSYNIGAITLCLAGLMSPLLAAILMPMSSVLTLFLAVGLLRQAGANGCAPSGSGARSSR